MASDAPSLARWWRAFCAGEIVSQASLNEMTTLSIDGYGLGLYDVAESYEQAVGHAGEGIRATAMLGDRVAGWVPARGARSRRRAEQSNAYDISEEVALALVEAASSD